MLEIIGESRQARRFAYVFIGLAFIAMVLWLSPDFLKALSEFILTLKQS